MISDTLVVFLIFVMEDNTSSGSFLNRLTRILTESTELILRN